MLLSNSLHFWSHANSIVVGPTVCSLQSEFAALEWLAVGVTVGVGGAAGGVNSGAAFLASSLAWHDTAFASLAFRV